MPNGNGNTKAFGGIVAVLAVIAGVYATVDPMNLRISSLQEDSREIKSLMQKDDDRERSDAAIMANLQHSIQDLEKRLVIAENWIESWKTKYPELNAKQDEKLEKLEWWLYSKAASTMFDGIPGNAPFSK